MEEKEGGSQVNREESDAEQGSEELPDPDREGPSPDEENDAERSDADSDPSD